MASPEALCGKLQKDIELKSSAAHYYKLWRKETHKIPTASSPNIQAVYFQCGTWNRNPCSHSYYARVVDDELAAMRWVARVVKDEDPVAMNKRSLEPLRAKP
ncbi:hypothetical protein CDL15_Pgr011011 [Punica granatum]|uniref:Bet v I/Major latex protein domain-containing protein n=1 Tax=Punica granatum TaxID=22663 RepID=A0A218XMG6_PUNGR|nr:hypothetical protein CDL15_Pgr011011 [Punica granatum]